MNNQRQLAAYGVDPSTLKGGFGNLQSNLAQAGATGNAVYNAGQNRQMQGFGMTGQAIGQGAGLAQTGQGYTGQGESMTGQGVQLGNQTIGTGSSALTAPSQWSQVGLQGQGQSANILNQQFQNQNTAYQTQNAGESSLMSGLGSVAGMAAMAFLKDGGPVQRFDDGGQVYIPSAQISPVRPVDIQPGARPPPQGQGGSPGSSFASGALGAVAKQGIPSFSRGQPALPQADFSASNQQYLQNSLQNQQIADPGIQVPQLANGGGIPGRKRHMSPPSGMAQNPGQMGTPGMGTAGPMTFADGGSPHDFAMNPEHNPMQAYRAPQPHAPQVRMPHGAPHLAQLPSAARLGVAHAADGGMPGATWSMGNVANGGPVQHPQGGHEPGTFISQGASDGTGIDDQVPAKVSVGEYVVPADVVHAKGKEFFDKLVARYHTPADQQRQQMGRMQ